MGFEFLLISLAAFVAALLTFFSGFGLGTLLMPVMALFFPLDAAVAVTAVVHLANNLFKVGLVGRFAHAPTVLRFGVPALLAAFVGAVLLESLVALETLASYRVGNITGEISWVKLLVGALIVIFVAVELAPAVRKRTFPARWMPVGGMLSGFLGGLSGHQGALRGMFLVKSGLTKEAYLGTSVVIAVMVDVARLLVYGSAWQADMALSGVAVAVIAAFCGSYIASRFINKVTISGIQTLVSVFLMLIGIGMVAGLI